MKDSLGMRSDTDVYGPASSTEDEARNRLLIRTASVLAIAMNLAYMAFYFSRRWWGPLLFDIPICFGLAVVHLASDRISVKSSASLLFALLTSAIFFVPNLFLGRGSGIHYLLLSIVPFIVIVFPRREDMQLVLIMGATDLLAFVLTEYTPFSPPLSVHAAPGTLTLLHMTSTGGMVLVISSLLFMLFWDMNKAKKSLDREHTRSESLLLNILPAAIAESLKASPDLIARTFPEATVLFADIAGFTELAGRLAPDRVVAILNQYFSAYDELADKHSVEKIKTIGDAYMAASGIPEARPDHAGAIMKMACDMLETTSAISSELGLDLNIRIGVNSGSVTAGVIGRKKFIYDLWGDTVNTAARMESQGIPGRIQVGPSTYNLLKDSFRFEGRGTIDVKGKGKLEVYLLR